MRAFGLVMMLFIGVSCGGGDDDEGGKLGACHAFGRFGSSPACTVNLSCAKGDYDLVCKPDEGGTTVTTCQCLEADQPGKTVEWDPAFCADQGAGEEFGAWLKSLAKRANSACGWNAEIR